MRALLVKPEVSPRDVNIDNSLESLQHAVGGTIQIIYPFKEPVGLICNDDGKLLGLPENRCLIDDDGEVYDVICGDFLIVGLVDNGDFVDLSPELVFSFKKRFLYPERFKRRGNFLMVFQECFGFNTWILFKLKELQ